MNIQKTSSNRLYNLLYRVALEAVRPAMQQVPAADFSVMFVIAVCSAKSF